MTKSVRMRVIVPADDAASVTAVVDNLREYLWSLGTKNLPIEPPNGTAEAAEGQPADLAGPIRGPRVHWAAADVLQGADRSEPPPPVAARKSRSSSART